MLRWLEYNKEKIKNVPGASCEGVIDKCAVVIVVLLVVCDSFEMWKGRYLFSGNVPER